MYNMKKERSYWEGTHAANRRIMYLAAGYEQEDIVKKPHIGIANTFFEGSPGTGHLRSLAESVKRGIWMNGGMPMEFGVPATCGNIAWSCGILSPCPSRLLSASTSWMDW